MQTRQTVLSVAVQYDPTKTDPDALADQLSQVLHRAVGTPGLLDECGKPSVGDFEAGKSEDKEFVVAVTWVVSGQFKVMAKSLHQAQEKVFDDPLYQDLPKGEYVDDSLKIDHDTTRELNDDT